MNDFLMTILSPLDLSVHIDLRDSLLFNVAFVSGARAKEACVVLNSIGSNHTCKQCNTTIFVIRRCKTRVNDCANDCVNDVLLELCNSVHKIVPK